MLNLADKITSADQLRGCPGVRASVRGLQGYEVDMPWWLKREWLRIEQKIYPEPTEAVDALNKLTPQYALHISKLDPEYVAYTPDKVFGESDRQLKTSLGKFVAKYYPHLKDEVVQGLVADHLGELNCEFEILTGEAITEVYLNGGGTKACMSKSEESFYGLDGHHPTEAYHAPNISMAVLRGKDGQVTARCMLYTPSDTDKRFIRVYGDLKLRKKLVRAGYVPGSWVGAVFNTVLLPTTTLDKVRVALPYLDANGSTGSPDFSTVAYIEGKLVCVDAQIASKVRDISGYIGTACATNTSGYYELSVTDSEGFVTECAVTGVKINLLENQRAYDYLLDGKLLKVCKEVYDSGFEVSYYTARSNRRVTVPQGTSVFIHIDGNNYVDTDEQRHYLSYRKLSPKYYPNDQEWVYCLRGIVPQGYIQAGEDLVRESDAVTAITLKEGRAKKHYAHQEEVGKGWVKVHSMKRGEPVWAAPDVQVVKTLGGRKVVPTVHAVSKTYSGVWEFDRNVELRTLFPRVAYQIVKSAPDIPLYSAEAYDTVRKKFSGFSESELDMCRAINATYPYAQIRDVYIYRRGITKLADVSDCADIVNEPMFRHFNYILNVANAEAEALDYTNQHIGPTPTAVSPTEAEVPEASTYSAKTIAKILDLATSDVSSSRLEAVSCL